MIMKKYKLFLSNIEKEEKWIGKVLRDGYRLIRVNSNFLSYSFEKNHNNPNQIVKIDFREFSKNDEYENYKALFEDAGWRYICGSKSSGKHYFERVSAHATEDIFSDQTSRAERYKRISKMWFGLFGAFLPLIIALQSKGLFDLSRLFNWKEFYLTPGLWEMPTLKFWAAFLFETPFALGRGVSAWLLLITVIGFVSLGIRASYWYYKEKV